MCRTAGRRCPCDTSEKRRLRRRNSNLNQEYSKGVKTPATPPKITTSNESDAIKDSIENFYRDLPTPGSFYSDEELILLDKRTVELGNSISKLAETKYDAPTQEDFDNHNRTVIKEVEERLNNLSLEYDQNVKELAKIQEPYNGLPSSQIIEELSNEDKEKFQALRLQNSELYKQISEANKSVKDAFPYELLRKRNDAFKAALEESGVFFGLPEQGFIFTDKTSEEDNKALNEALQYIPTAWLEKSNIIASQTELIVKSHTGRIHYSHYEMKNDVHKTAKIQVVDFVSDEEMATGDYVKLENGKYLDPVSKEMEPLPFNDPYAQWVKITTESQVSDTKPKGVGWKKLENNVWKRTPVKSTKLKSGKTHSEVLVGGIESKYKILEHSSTSGIIHEFSHRFEYIVPGLAKQEEAFLKRRANLYNTDAKPERIYKGTQEKGYKGNFTNDYMGKVYDSNVYEILSMGMECLWAGQEGGFVGAEKDSLADKDYLNFMLGILASNGRK